MLWSTGCAGSSVGDAVQQSLEADPRLADQGGGLGPGEENDAEESPRTPAAADSTTTDGAARDDADRPSGDSSRSPSPPPSSDQQRPGDPDIEVATGGADQTAEGGASAPAASQSSPALGTVPEDLKPYIEDLMALNLFSRAADPSGQTSASTVAFAPNQSITRGQYATWLLTANNLFYSDQPSQKIRAASPNATPAFQDVPPSHPDFGAIQGLAEAGLIPSALTGNSTAVNFRPDAPLTRESLLVWKVPLDIRTTLPSASVEAVQATWGFQDAAEIEPLALRAVLADHQTGDFANILRGFGYTTLFQPQKAVTQAEAAATLWRFGSQTEGISAEELLQRSPSNGPSAP
jgi:hypothetical protein